MFRGAALLRHTFTAFSGCLWLALQREAAVLRWLVNLFSCFRLRCCFGDHLWLSSEIFLGLQLVLIFLGSLRRSSSEYSWSLVEDSFSCTALLPFWFLLSFL